MKNRGAKIKQILELARHSGIVSSGEVRSHGIHYEYLRQVCTAGKFVSYILRDTRAILTGRTHILEILPRVQPSS